MNVESIRAGSRIEGIAAAPASGLTSGRPVTEGLSLPFLRQASIYVYELPNGETHAAIAGKESLAALDAIAWSLQREVIAEWADVAAINMALERIPDESGSPGAHADITAGHLGEEETVESLRDLASGAPVVRAVNEIIELALKRRVTDIHLEPVRDAFRVRMRIDGLLTTVKQFSAQLGRPIVSRVKILAALDIAERRLPQDGRTRVRVSGHDLDVRVATMPTAFGEAAVLRLLSQGKDLQTFESLGLAPRDRDRFAAALDAPHGMIVVTGPTGSGKTTTLAAALTRLNDSTRKILTIEDPIEYEIDGINQTQVKPAIGLTFANALRAFLRQDPDIVMVGEMRDGETAHVGIQAALTGHLVLTTLHTNTAVSAITRLIDLQVEPFLISASLQCVVAQRLVRRLCTDCRKPVKVDAKLKKRNPRISAFKLDGKTVFDAVGCDRCGNTGYIGRRAVFELLPVTETVRHLISRGASESDLETAARKDGMTTLMEDGVRAAAAGETSLDEVLRVTASR